jgi:hypothetical protein
VDRDTASQYSNMMKLLRLELAKAQELTKLQGSDDQQDHAAGPPAAAPDQRQRNAFGDAVVADDGFRPAVMVGARGGGLGAGGGVLAPGRAGLPAAQVPGQGLGLGSTRPTRCCPQLQPRRASGRQPAALRPPRATRLPWPALRAAWGPCACACACACRATARALQLQPQPHLARRRTQRCGSRPAGTRAAAAAAARRRQSTSRR